MVAGDWNLVASDDIVDTNTLWVQRVDSPAREVAADPTLDQTFLMLGTVDFVRCRR